MRILITGGSGFVGGGIVRELVAAGHTVTGLARSEASAAKLESLGSIVVPGDINEPETYCSVAAEHDAIIHAAFDYGAGDAAAISADKRTIETLLAAARSRLEPCQVIYTSSAFLLGGLGETPVDEKTVVKNPAHLCAWRFRHEDAVLSQATEKTATAVVRVGMVYGGSGGIMNELYEIAESGEAVPFIEEGDQHYPLVHLDDLAELYRLIVERRVSGVFHGVDGLAVTAKDLAAAVNEKTGKTGGIRRLSLEAARGRWGSSADFLAQDVRVAAPRANALGWNRRHHSFLEKSK